MEPVDSYHDLIRSDVFPVLPTDVGCVLDVGGGIGATSVALKSSGRASRISIIDRVSGQLDDVDSVHLGDLDDATFIENVIAIDGPFDTILALDVLEHLRDPWRTVIQLRNGLSKDGYLVASIPNVNYHRLIIPLLLRGRYILTDSGILDRTHLRWFARHGAVELMSPPGLLVEHVQTNIPSKRERLFDRLTLGLLTRFVTLQYVVRARRID